MAALALANAVTASDLNSFLQLGLWQEPGSFSSPLPGPSQRYRRNELLQMCSYKWHQLDFFVRVRPAQAMSNVSSQVRLYARSWFCGDKHCVVPPPCLLLCPLQPTTESRRNRGEKPRAGQSPSPHTRTHSGQPRSALDSRGYKGEASFQMRLGLKVNKLPRSSGEKSTTILLALFVHGSEFSRAEEEPSSLPRSTASKPPGLAYGFLPCLSYTHSIPLNSTS